MWSAAQARDSGQQAQARHNTAHLERAMLGLDPRPVGMAQCILAVLSLRCNLLLSLKIVKVSKTIMLKNLLI